LRPRSLLRHISQLLNEPQYSEPLLQLIILTSRSSPDVPCTNATIYVFESFPSQLGNLYNVKFCEAGVDESAECFDGKMRYQFEHACGIGRTLHPQVKWRHVSPEEIAEKVWLPNSICIYVLLTFLIRSLRRMRRVMR
jgi:hypothetical protein